MIRRADRCDEAGCSGPEPVCASSARPDRGPQDRLRRKHPRPQVLVQIRALRAHARPRFRNPATGPRATPWPASRGPDVGSESAHFNPRQIRAPQISTNLLVPSSGPIAQGHMLIDASPNLADPCPNLVDENPIGALCRSRPKVGRSQYGVGRPQPRAQILSRGLARCWSNPAQIRSDPTHNRDLEAKIGAGSTENDASESPSPERPCSDDAV